MTVMWSLDALCCGLNVPTFLLDYIGSNALSLSSNQGNAKKYNLELNNLRSGILITQKF